MNAQLLDQKNKLTFYLQDYFDPQPIKLRINRNRVTYLSAIMRRQIICISAHEVFLRADESIWLVLADFCQKPTEMNRRKLDYFIENSSTSLLIKPKTNMHLRGSPIGFVHDLNRIMARAVELGFDQKFPLELPYIMWGRRGRPGRNLCLGSYRSEEHLIRIHPVLDDPHVPEEYVISVIHHELLHALFRPKVSLDKRRQVHTKEFREAEKSFPLYSWAKNWEKQCLTKLINKQRRRFRG